MIFRETKNPLKIYFMHIKYAVKTINIHKKIIIKYPIKIKKITIVLR